MNLKKQCEEAEDRLFPNFKSTWADRACFTGRRVIVIHPGRVWNDLYLVDPEQHTATFTGHQMPAVGHDAPLYDHDLGYIGNDLRLVIITGPNRGRYVRVFEEE